MAKRGIKKQKWISVIHVAEGVWGNLSSSPMLDHCSWSQTINETPCSGHARRVRSSSSPGRGQGLAGRGGCFHLLASKHVDGQIEHPSITTLVPIPGLMALAAAHHFVTDRI